MEFKNELRFVFKKEDPMDYVPRPWNGPTRSEQRKEESRQRQAELAKISKRHRRNKW